MTSLENSPEKSRESYRIFMWLSVLLTLLAYSPLMNNNFVNWDDPIFIQNNPHIRNFNPSSLRWMFTNSFAGYWIPVYWLSLALDYHLLGLEPWVYHLDNLILHCLNTALVFAICFKILTFGRKRMEQDNEKHSPAWITSSAFGTSLVFGLHPIHVESVAWATERKDLLCGLFFFSSLLVYLGYATETNGKTRKYLSGLGLFILALLSKPMAVSLPIVFLLLDMWPLGRFYPKPAKVFFEKIPFLIVSLFSGGMTVLFQFQAGNTLDLDILPMSYRIMNSFHSLIFYLAKMLIPTNLTTFYPIFLKNTFSVEYLFSALLVFSISLIFLIYRKQYPYLASAWLYYFFTLAPVLGFLQSNSVAAADRYTYLPCLGPFLLLVTALVKLFSRWRFALIALAVGWTALLGYGTFHQVSIWKNSVTLWENVLRIYPRNNIAVYTNLAASYEDAGRLNDALAEYDRAIATGVPLANPHYGKGKILVEKGLINEAIQEFKTSITLDPTYAPPHSDLGMVYERKGLHTEALAEIHEAIRLDPEYAPAYNNLGVVCGSQGQMEESIAALQKARSLDPDNWKYFWNLIAVYQQTGKYKQALALYQELSN